MNVTLTAKIEIETDAQPTEEQLIADFDGYMGECLNLPHGNVFDHNTGRDEGEIRLTSFNIEKDALSLDQDQQKVFRLMLLNVWANRQHLGFQEHLGTEEHTEDWLNDVITDLTEKVKITPEETW